MQTVVGAITIGQAPRDDIVPAMQQLLGSQVRFVEAGALDDVSPEQIQDMIAGPDERAHVTRLRDSTPTPRLSHARWVPLMQAALDRVVARGAQIVVVLCASDWSELRSDRLILNAGPLCDGVVHQLAAGKRLGVIRPRPDSPQEVQERQKVFDQFRIDPVTAVLNPYDPRTTPDDFARVGEELRQAGAELVYLACMGMHREFQDAVRRTAGCPVLSAQGILASVLQLVVAGLPLPSGTGISR